MGRGGAWFGDRDVGFSLLGGAEGGEGALARRQTGGGGGGAEQECFMFVEGRGQGDDASDGPGGAELSVWLGGRGAAARVEGERPQEPSAPTFTHACQSSSRQQSLWKPETNGGEEEDAITSHCSQPRNATGGGAPCCWNRTPPHAGSISAGLYKTTTITHYTWRAPPAQGTTP